MCNHALGSRFLLRLLFFLAVPSLEANDQYIKAHPKIYAFIQQIRVCFLFRIENQHVQFRVEPNEKSLDAPTMARVLGEY